jgi:mannose-6-phosphate isomerase class I
MEANAKVTYDLEPEVRVSGFDGEAYEGASQVTDALTVATRNAGCVVVDCYPGVGEDALGYVTSAFAPTLTVRSDDVFLEGEELERRIAPILTDDRVRGVMYYGVLRDFVVPERLAAAQEQVARELAAGGRVLVYGVGASLVAATPDVLIYCDLGRWNIELRYRAGMPNFRRDNASEDPLRKIKCGYFLEWRVADKHKMSVFNRVDWFLDTNDRQNPKLVSGTAVRTGLEQCARRPFRCVPYFDPGVWGGHWMQERFGLDPEQPNFAWSFDGVPEENSLYLRFVRQGDAPFVSSSAVSDDRGDARPDGVRIELPCMDLVLSQPVELLGMRNYCRFGAEFPIRFDFLDTMGGQNLSLQVHPLTEYIKSKFGMPYTQDESYYILDAGEGAGVYLGIRDGADPAQMMSALRTAQAGGEPFDAERYVNLWPAKKHDHFLIPAGTVHCSAANTVVLEISATPYNFTFKLWDWGRLGLDGLPRPIHIEDGERNIQWDRRTDWVRKNLVNATREVARGDGWVEEHTGLHQLEFIETRRFTATVPTEHDATEGFHMLNIVDGPGALISSPSGAFKPYEVHYAETFIVPAAAGRYVVTPLGADADGRDPEIKFVQAYVRQTA